VSRKHIELIVKTHFDKDTSSHVMTVFRDDGVNRHIRFSRPDSGIFHFDLITWPGCLCYTGDMGTYVFKRLDDMFEFFRTDNGRINLSYWSEKLVAADCNGRGDGGGVVEFDGDAFTKAVNEYRLNWVRDGKRSGRLTKEQRQSLWEAIDDDVLSHIDDGEHLAMNAAYAFRWGHAHLNGTRIYRFDDFFECNVTEYTHSFVWCCHAIAWGIQVYDEATKQGGLQ